MDSSMEDVKNSESSSESEDEEDSEIQNEQETLLKIQEYRQKIKHNELDYEAHVGLIATLRKVGEFDELRQARKIMNKIYPLSTDLWMEWLSDEQKICTTKEERSFIITLFEKAVSEYTSVKLWVEYIMFMLGCGNMEATRAICEKALMSVGIHLAEGILIWQAYLLVEQQFLANILLENNEKKIEEQKKKIQGLYRRQARVPLMNFDKNDFLCEASKWFDNEEVDPNVIKDLERSHRKMLEKVPYEEALIRAADEVEKLEAYRKYIDAVSSDDNPSLIQNIYERTIADLCLNAGLWEEYVRFLLEQFPSSDYVVLPVCERSQMNCPWSGTLCELHIYALEKFSNIIGDTEANLKIKASLQKILMSGVTLGTELIKAWMAYLVYLRRKILWKEDHVEQLEGFREACIQALEFLDKQFGEEGDTECEIARFQARVEAESAKNIEGARKIWNDYIMKRNKNSKSAVLWLEFINLERSFGTENYCRKLFRRALERNWDCVEIIGTAFLQFEQELGTLESISDFHSRYRDRLSIVRKKRLEDAAKIEKETFDNQIKSKKGKPSQAPTITSPTKNKTSEKVFKKPFDVAKKTANKGSQNLSAVEVTSPPGYKRLSEEDANKDTKNQTGNQNLSAMEVAPPPGYKRPAEEDAENVSKRQRVEQPYREHVRHDSSLDHRTVFLSNLDYMAEDKVILPVFADFGKITNLRISRDFKGRSKGFGYLTFESPEMVEKALKLDRTPIEGRPLYISRCNPREREHAFKYSTGLEKEKLFIRGLVFSMKEQDIRDAFEPHGEIKSIRLITHRNGYSKGTCYIEYHNAATAENVMKKMDGAMLRDSKISVQFSNPSASKSIPTQNNPSGSSFFSSSAGPSPSGTQRPKLSLLPRSLLRKSATNNPPPLNGNHSISSDVEEIQPKSNDDFRKLLKE